MRQRLTLNQEQQELLDACDFGIEPRPDTTMTLDILLHDNWVQPVVYLRRGEKRYMIATAGGFELSWLEARDCSAARLQKEATVLLALEEDPDSPMIHLFVEYGGRRFERRILESDVRHFLFLPYIGGQDIDLNDQECEELFTFQDYERPEKLAA